MDDEQTSASEEVLSGQEDEVEIPDDEGRLTAEDEAWITAHGVQPTEDQRLAEDAAKHLDRSLYITRHIQRTFERHDFEGEEPDEEDVQWVLSQVARFEAGSLFAPQDAQQLHLLEDLREHQAFLLLDVKQSFRDDELRDALEKEAAEVHKRSRSSGEYILEVAGRSRGYIFERLCAKVALNDKNLETILPEGLAADAEARRAYIEKLGELRQRVVPPGPRWRRGNVVGELVFQDVIKTPHYRALRAELREQGRELYIHSPIRDPNGRKLAQGEKDKETLVLRYDSGEKRWLVSGDAASLAENRANIEPLEEYTQERNLFHYREGGRPDGILLAGRVIAGFSEAKCYWEAEMVALVNHLEGQSEADIRRDFEAGGKMGRFFSQRELNESRAQLGKEPLRYPVDPDSTATEEEERRGFRLALNLPAEIIYTAIAANKDEKEVVALLRLPGNITPETMKRLHEQLERRGIKAIIQRINVMTADEVGELALSHIRRPEFAESLSEKWQPDLSEREKEKNLRARALALGVRRLGDLEEKEIPVEYGVRDYVIAGIRTQLGAEIRDLLGEEKTWAEKRVEQLRLLKEHYLTFKGESD